MRVYKQDDSPFNIVDIYTYKFEARTLFIKSDNFIGKAIFEIMDKSGLIYVLRNAIWSKF